MNASDAATPADSTPPAITPRVLHVADQGHFARFGRMYRQLGLALSESGVDVTLLTADADAAASFEGTPINASYFKPLRGWGIWKLHNYLRKQFDPAPDIVHLWGVGAIGYLSDWTQRTGAVLLIHAASIQDVEKLKRRGLHQNERLVAACGQYGAVLEEHWAPSTKNIPVYKPALLWPAKSREFQPGERIPGVIWTGAFDRGAGLEVLVDAVARLCQKGDDFQVGLIGRGPAVRDVWREIRRRGVSNQFSIVTEPRVWDQTIAGADVVVLPTCQRKLSLAPLLAMSLGKVVIASRDQIADWFIEDKTALMFAPGSSVELAYHLSRVAAGHHSVRTLASNAAEYVREHHAITILADKLAELYRKLTGDARKQLAGAAKTRGIET